MKSNVIELKLVRNREPEPSAMGELVVIVYAFASIVLSVAVVLFWAYFSHT